MKEHKFKIVVLENGKIVVDGIPVKQGQEVEVSIRFDEQLLPDYPLRGLPIRYDDPFLPAVPESDWDALKSNPSPPRGEGQG